MITFLNLVFDLLSLCQRFLRESYRYLNHLYKIFVDRFEKVNKDEIIKSDPLRNKAKDHSENDEKLLAKRERRNLLMAIAILVEIIRGYNEKMKLSALHISEMMKDKVADLGVESAELGSFDRKITEALKLLAEESLSLE